MVMMAIAGPSYGDGDDDNGSSSKGVGDAGEDGSSTKPGGKDGDGD
jgi:hypothetical protein